MGHCVTPGTPSKGFVLRCQMPCQWMAVLYCYFIEQQEMLEGNSPVMLEAVGDVDNEFVAPVRFDQGTRESPVHGKDLSLEAIGGECRIRRD